MASVERVSAFELSQLIFSASRPFLAAQKLVATTSTPLEICTTSVTYPGSLGTVTLGHDTEGKLATVSDWDARVTTLGYYALDRVTTITRPADLVTSYAYDALSRVTAIDHVHDGTPLLELGGGFSGITQSCCVISPLLLPWHVDLPSALCRLGASAWSWEMQ